MIRRFIESIGKGWRVFRTLAGDDAYEQYCAHHHARHAHGGIDAVAHEGHEELLDRRTFFAKYQQEKWNGIRRCC